MRPVVAIFAAGLLVPSFCATARAATTCFQASKTYRIHPRQGGADITDGWVVVGDAFNQCVHRAEAAEKSLQTRYADRNDMSLIATIGCHMPCGR